MIWSQKDRFSGYSALNPFTNGYFMVLKRTFSFPLQSLLEAHDIVASKCYDSPPSSPEVNNSSVNNQVVPVDAIRILGIHKRAGEPLVSN